MKEITDRAAREQRTSHERALLERLLPSREWSGAEIAHQRGVVQNERARLAVEAKRAVVEHSALHERFGDAPLEWWTPAAHDVEVGEPMLVRGSIYGAYDGCNWLGEPYVRAVLPNKDLTLRSTWREVCVLRPRGFEPVATKVIGADERIAVDERAARAFDASLDEKAIGPYSVRHFVQALRRAGFFVCMRGSAVRDALNGEPVKDVDLVTTAPEAHAWAAIEAAAPEYDLSAFRLPLRSRQNGTLQLAAKLTSPTDRGFQLSTTKRWGIASMGERWRDDLTRFGHNLEEDAWAHDFRINTLYAFLDERDQWWLIDPTGGALDDVRRRHLTPQRWPDNITNPARFWKFRARGYSSDASTTQQMVAQLARVSAHPERLAWSFKLIVASYPSVAAFLEAMEPVMREDGAGELFEHVRMVVQE